MTKKINEFTQLGEPPAYDDDIAGWDTSAAGTVRMTPGEILAVGDQVYIDAPKDSADTPDDDFDSGTLADKWTAVSGVTGSVSLFRTAATAIYDLSSRSGWLLAQVGSSAKLELRQDYTLPSGASIILAIAPAVLADGAMANNELWIGFGLNDNDTGYDQGNWQAIFLDAHTHADYDNGVRWLHWEGTNFRQGATTFEAESSHGVEALPAQVYLRIARDSGDYYAFFSVDGSVWMPMGAFTPSAAYDNIWLFVHSKAAYGTPVPVQAIRWIRLGTNGVDPW